MMVMVMMIIIMMVMMIIIIMVMIMRMMIIGSLTCAQSASPLIQCHLQSTIFGVEITLGGNDVARAERLQEIIFLV